MSEELKNNALIARFMGYSVENWTTNPLKPTGACLIDGKVVEMKFNSDWNQLIPVIEKIEKGNYGFKMCRKVVEIYFDDTKQLILKAKEASRMESLYRAVLDFIKWSNERENKKTISNAVRAYMCFPTREKIILWVKFNPTIGYSHDKTPLENDIIFVKYVNENNKTKLFIDEVIELEEKRKLKNETNNL